MTEGPRKSGRWLSRRGRYSISDIAVQATCVRVPVFVGHGEAVNIECAKPIDEDEAREALREAPGVVVVDHRANEGYVTPVECAGEDAVYVSRIRKDLTVKNGFRCGWFLTTCARVQLLTRCRLPKCSFKRNW